MSDLQAFDYGYQVGGTIAADSPVYVERSADSELLATLESGKFCYVFNSRQMGKSSLRVRTQAKLLDRGWACASIDLTNVISDGISESQFYNGLMAELTEALDLDFQRKAWLSAQDDLSPVQQFGNFVAQVVLGQIAQPIAIFIDEIDSTLRLNFSIDPFFARIRSFYNQRSEQPEFQRLTFCLVGVAAPSQLIRDRTQTPFNIGEAIELSGLELAAALGPLGDRLPGTAAEREQTLAEILDWTGGQPFLTQRLCALVRDNEGEPVAMLVQREIVERWQFADPQEHFKARRDRLLEANPANLGRRLGCYQRVLASADGLELDSSEEELELCLVGLVRSQEGRLRVYNRIYGVVFDSVWVAAELAKLRPYEEEFQAWYQSGKDQKYLLRGEALQAALQFRQGKQLATQDEDFLLASANHELSQSNAQLASINNELRQSKTQLASANNELRQSKAQLASINNELRQSKTQLASANNELRQSKAQLASTNNELKQSKAQLASTNNELRQSKAQLASTNDEFRQSKAQLASANDELRQSKAQLASANDELRQFKAQLASTNDEFRQSKAQLASANDELRQSKAQLASANDELRQSKAQLASTKAQVRLQLQRAGTLSSVLFVVTGVAIWFGIQQIRRASTISQLEQTSRAVINQFPSRPKESLVQATQTLQSLKTLEGGSRTFSDLSITGPVDALANVLAQAQADDQVLRQGGAVLDTSWSPNGMTLATGSVDNTVKLWNVASSQLIGMFQEHVGAVVSVAWSPDGKTLATGSMDRSVKLWNPVSGRAMMTLQGYGGSVTSLSWSPDGRILATSSGDNTVKLWRMTDGQAIPTSQNHGGDIRSSGLVSSFSWSPNGKALAIGSMDKTVTLWSVVSDQVITTLNGHRDAVLSVSWSPDGKTLATGSADGTVKLWKMESGQLISTLEGHSNWILSVSWSPDSKTLATSSRDETVKLWNVTNGQIIATLQGHQGWVASVRWSPDGKTLATSSYDGTVRLWPMTIDGLLDKACAYLKPYLTHPDHPERNTPKVCDYHPSP